MYGYGVWASVENYPSQSLKGGYILRLILAPLSLFPGQLCLCPRGKVAGDKPHLYRGKATELLRVQPSEAGNQRIICHGTPFSFRLRTPPFCNKCTWSLVPLPAHIMYTFAPSPRQCTQQHQTPLTAHMVLAHMSSHLLYLHIKYNRVCIRLKFNANALWKRIAQ